MQASSDAPVPDVDPLFSRVTSANSSAERVAAVQVWLASSPSVDQLQAAFKEVQARDKGAAKPIKERLDEARRVEHQDTQNAIWAEKAQALLDQQRLKLADALAWQRDAARAGAALAKEPLASLKQSLAARAKQIEDLERRMQIHRETALLLAQRTEVLSTKSWTVAQQSHDALQRDIGAWVAQKESLVQEDIAQPIEPRHVTALSASGEQLRAVWQAFDEALVQARVAADDANAPLPAVPVWADELLAERQTKGEALVAHDSSRVSAAREALGGAIGALEKELEEGHGKASSQAAQELRSKLAEFGLAAGAVLRGKAQAALHAASEMEGWQRWRADQIREKLLEQASALASPPADAPPMGGRKLQETLRTLREQWKLADHGGHANHALWRKFDEACNVAHKRVEAWLAEAKAQSAEHRAQRLALIEEAKAHGAQRLSEREDGATVDWRAENKALQALQDKWRHAGHLGDKAFAELQPLWKNAFADASRALADARTQSTLVRQRLIQQATELAGTDPLPIAAVKAVQRDWQTESQRVPLDRKHEQRLWDAFRKPLDEAFTRLGEKREQQRAAVSEHDRQVMEAARALEAAIASKDMAAIRGAREHLESARRASANDTSATLVKAAAQTERSNVDVQPDLQAVPGSGGDTAVESTVSTDEPTRQAPKPVIARRGDDRPGAQVATASAPPRQRPASDRSTRREGESSGRDGSVRGFQPRGNRFDNERTRGDGPRLGDAAFRAQRDALAKADHAMRHLAESSRLASFDQLLQAWASGDADAMPAATTLGKRMGTKDWQAWRLAVGQGGQSEQTDSLLRLEIAADVPSPANELSQRRMLQLGILTNKRDAPPQQTWAADVAKVLAGKHRADHAARLRQVLAKLLA